MQLIVILFVLLQGYDALWTTMRCQNPSLSVISSCYFKPTADIDNPTYATANSVKDTGYSDKIKYYTTHTNARVAERPISAQTKTPDMPATNITELGSLEAVRLVQTKSNATSVYQAATSRHLSQDENGRFIDKRNNAVIMSSNQYLTNAKQNSAGTSVYQAADSRQLLQDENGRFTDKRNNGVIMSSNQYLTSAKQNSAGALDYSSNPALMQINALTGASSLVPVDSKASAKSDGPGKWDHVMNAKDDLIRQKDIIIAR